MIEQLTKVWKSYETRELAKIFETYMKNIGAKKHILNNSTYEKKDGKPNSYFIDGKTTGWNRVQLYYCKEPFEFCNEDLEITLRKRAGNYLIIARKGERAFEVDYSGLRNYNESLMNEIYSDHKELFDVLFEGGKT